MKTVVIAGAGTMGASLAQVYSRAGWNTVLYNRSEKGLERAERLIALNQDTMIREGLLTEEDARQMSRCLSMTTEKAAFAQADLVVENIKEDMEVKKEFWEETSRMTKESALLATNTSGLSITEIARAVWKPQRFMGQHWLNPPHLLPLCEIVIGQQTSWENAQSMRALLKEMGKQPVVVKDIRGFIINRIQFALLREALYIVESGAASFEDVDMVLKAGMGLRYAVLGPFGVADFGGLDVFDHTVMNIPQMMADFVYSITDSPAVFLVIVNVLLVIAGMFLDAGSAIMILSPVLLPIALSLQIDPLAFGIIMVVNLSIGVLTPPVGLNLYVVSSLSNLDIMRVAKACMPFILMIFAMLIVCSFFPQILTFLPELLYG